jgi:hypothetical protein
MNSAGLTVGHGFSRGVRRRIRHCSQALHYALSVLPYGQHRASLRACPQWEH